MTGGSYTGVMPVFNGYYADRGGFMLRIDPNDGDIGLCINYGNFSEATGIVEGDDVTITLQEKGGALPGALPGRQGSHRVRDHDA